MESVLDALLQYAQDQRLGGGLTWEYWRLLRQAKEAREVLESRLSAPDAQALARFLALREKADWLESRALFRCGLSMGVELGRMGQGM